MPVVLLFLSLMSLAQAQVWKDWSFVKACSIYNMSGSHVRTFPGAYCIFLPDGTYISATETVIRRLNPENDVLWEIPGEVHHQMKLSPDGKRILALLYTVYNGAKGPQHEDKFISISLEGKILTEQVASEVYRQTGEEHLNWSTRPNSKKIEKEISHFNSIYEIPEVKRKDRPAWMQKGNIVINGLGQRIYILSSDMKKVLHHEKFPTSVLHRAHDVQITPRGTILFYNNAVNNPTIKPETWDLLGGGGIQLYSSIEEMEPNGKKVNEFTAQPKEIFYSWACGGVQELDQDTWLFNHIVNGVFIYSKKQNKFLMNTIQTNVDWATINPAQEVKASDLRKFFSFWK